MSQYKPMRLKTGVVLQSGLNAQPAGAKRRVIEPRDGPYRAIVINTYMPDSSKNLLKHAIECDVLLVKSNAFLPRVAVLQRAGVNEAQTWVPKPTTRVISTNVPFNAKIVGASSLLTPSFDDLDGDMVLVDFIECDVNYPVITQQITHEQTNRKIKSGSGWAELDLGSSRGTPQEGEHYVNHRGTEFRINQKGDVLIDTVGAHDEDITESPLTGQGQVRVRIKNLQKFTIECDGEDVLEVYKDALGVTHVDLGENATEPIVLGNKLVTFLSALTVPTAFGPSGTPINAPTLTAPATAILSAQHKTK